jgi:hypothetical protein
MLAPGIFNHQRMRSVMARFAYSKWGCAAITGGVILTAIEVYGAVGYLVSQGQPNYLVAGGAVVTIVAAILPVLAARSWAARQYLLAILMWMAMVPALSVIVCAAVERTGSANDLANRDRQAIAQSIALARSTEKDAKAIADADEAAAMVECASGRKARCLGLEARADSSRQRLEAARTAVAQAGVAPNDPMASRIAAALPVSEEAVRIYQPLILPLSISALGLLLIASGAHQPKRREAQKRKGKRKQRRRKAVPQPSRSNVVPLRKA